MNEMNLATIEQVVAVLPHPDPEVERLEIVQVLEYKCIVMKGSFAVGDLCVFIQPDSVLPDAEWTTFYKKSCKTRVKALKIRGFVSFGIVEKISLVGDHCLGDDVTELLGITKYEQTISQEGGRNLPWNIVKTDETNWQKKRDLQHLLNNSIVDVTLKIDGSSCSIGCKKDHDEWKLFVLSRTQCFDIDQENKYTSVMKKYDVANKLLEYCKRHDISICLRGELFGGNIRSSKINPHCNLEQDIAFFSSWLIDECRYAGRTEVHNFVNICRDLDIPHVPILEHEVTLTRDLIDSYRSVNHVVINDQSFPFEGVVIKGDDFSFKVINEQYDMKKD